MPTNKYEIYVNGKLLFIKFTTTETNRLVNLLNTKGIKHNVIKTSFI
jgi:hypothetical protein